MKSGGKASIICPLAALYPLVVVLLVPFILHESTTLLQAAGVMRAYCASVERREWVFRFPLCVTVKRARQDSSCELPVVPNRFDSYPLSSPGVAGNLRLLRRELPLRSALCWRLSECPTSLRESALHGHCATAQLIMYPVVL
jgi:hypothetical protein